MQAATIEAADWWARPRGEQAANWIANYQRSLQARHRTAIARIVRELGAETLLEVGCHCGPNLVRLAKEQPTLRAIGVDISAEAVQAGKRWVAQEQLTDRVQINVGRLPEVAASLPSGAFDVVLSCYTIAYVAPADLDAVLYEMGRLAGRAVILAEPMAWGDTPAGVTRSMTGYTEWRHDYRSATQWIGSWRDLTTRIEAVDPPVDKLNAVLIAARGAQTITSMP